MRARSFVYVTFVYAIALGAALVILETNPTVEPLLALALADFAATVVVFVSSRRANNSSIYDPYWSVIPIAIALWFARGSGFNFRAVLALIAVCAWGARLTWNWARGWEGLLHEDWRYVDIRRQTGKMYWPASFFGLHLMPSVLTYLGSLSLLPALVGRTAFGVLDALGGVVLVAAIAIETVADEQLRNFRRAKSDGTCAVGLWRYSRHPNYFGEILFWVGLWLLGLGAGAPLWMAIGPVAMGVLFVFASIPLAEKRSLQRRPEYARHIARTSMLIPWPPGR